jgi:endonuclease/exonuclease/phosphatase family metal-dependent hydrolase
MLKLMTFNIRYGSADDGPCHWDNRKSLIIDRINAFGPDLLGLQECQDDFQAKFIKDHLQEYEFFGVRRAGGSVTALEMAPILFRKSVFRLVQKGCFWLSKTPQAPGSQSWGSIFPRTATWVELVHQGSNRVLIFLNTHFDYEPSAIEESAKLLGKWIRTTTGTRPIIVTGDFNAEKNSTAYLQLTEKSALRDVYRQVQTGDGNEGTFHGFGREAVSKPIDWMLVSAHFEVLDAEIDRYHKDDLYPSDHYPVTAILDWK